MFKRILLYGIGIVYLIVSLLWGFGLIILSKPITVFLHVTMVIFLYVVLIKKESNSK
jgi:hypothetical protein